MTQTVLTPNYIKYINIESIFDVLTPSGTNEKEIENILSDMESSQEFKNLFFYCDEKDHSYYYQYTDTMKIKNFLSQHIDISKLTKSDFEDLAENLVMWNGGGYIQIGVLKIEESDLYTILRDDYLHNRVYIEKLVKSGNELFSEIEKLKYQILNRLVDEKVSEIKSELKYFRF